jgi:glutamyl-tRNA synthetase
MSEKVRVRFAPSPTGYLHVGGLRSALYNYLFAKKRGGEFILRIEDTDRSRFVDGAIESLISSLDRMGMKRDEGVFLENGHLVQKGDVGPYIQSERLELYRKYADELVAKKKAYHCFCATERLEAMRTEQMKNKQAPKYDKQCLLLSDEEISKRKEAGEPFVIRLNVLVERGDVVFTDLVRGEVKFNVKDVDDQVLMKSDGFPTYHLANVVDDHLMHITQVIRGEEWVSSTPKHILLYEAFGWDAPEFAHLPLLLNADKSKLSKRQGDVAAEDYLGDGYLEEALVNFVALLGWNPGQGTTQEIFTLDELVEQFELSNVHKAGAVFDRKKLDWLNGEYIKKMPVDELYRRIDDAKFLEKDLIRNAPSDMQTEEYLKRVLTIERERLAKLSDVGEQNLFFFATDPVYDAKNLNWKENTNEMTKESLARAMGILEKLSDDEWLKKESLEKTLMDAAGENRGDFLWPIRFALTGADKSPSPFDCAWVLGKKESLIRMRKAIELLG